jgi:hypothetical protein
MAVALRKGRNDTGLDAPHKGASRAGVLRAALGLDFLTTAGRWPRAAQGAHTTQRRNLTGAAQQSRRPLRFHRQGVFSSPGITR